MQTIKGFDAAARINRYFAVRYRTKRESGLWPFNGQDDSMATNLAQQVEPTPRIFAEFPLSKPWSEILAHAKRC
jgi:hypothetical protein